MHIARSFFKNYPILLLMFRSSSNYLFTKIGEFHQKIKGRKVKKLREMISFNPDNLNDF